MKLKSALAVLWTLLSLGAWCLSETWTIKHGTLVEFNIEGYDPRDLLAGHYLTYRVRYEGVPTCEEAQDNYCLCLSTLANTRLASVTWAGSCNSDIESRCSLWLKGRCDYGKRFEANIERFYIPESYAPYLQRVPDKAKIVVSVSGHGEANVQDLLVDNQGLSHYVDQQKLGSK